MLSLICSVGDSGHGGIRAPPTDAFTIRLGAPNPCHSPQLQDMPRSEVEHGQSRVSATCLCAGQFELGVFQLFLKSREFLFSTSHGIHQTAPLLLQLSNLGHPFSFRLQWRPSGKREPLGGIKLFLPQKPQPTTRPQGTEGAISSPARFISLSTH